MKTKKTISFVLALFTISLFMILSCSKQDSNIQTSATTDNNAVVQKNIKTLLGKLPKTVVVDGKVVNLSKSGFDFSTPNDGFNYSSNEGVNYSEETHTLYLEAGSFGSGLGGTIIAGNTSLDINYTFCFSASEQGLGFNFFGDSLSGVSSVIAISGDFEKLKKITPEEQESEDFDISEYFNGIAIYMVYDNEAKGSYNIVNWLDNIDKCPEDLHKKGFAYIIDFKNNKLFLSSSGKLNVSGGSIAFNGKYMEISDFINFDEEEKPVYKEVDGYGTIGCQ
jgi:hypothetical protein